MKFLRSIFSMQTVEERAAAEQLANQRAIFEAEKALHHKRQELALLRKRQAHLTSLMGVPA